MRIRDALESDAEALATALDRPRDAVLDMIHDRSVRIGVGDGTHGKDFSDDGGSGPDTATIDGFVAFDVHGGTVHVTDFGGGDAAVRRLFEEPRRFASREGLAVEVVVPDDEDSGSVVEAVGFEPTGAGPRFEGRPTTRYRIGADEIE